MECSSNLAIPICILFFFSHSYLTANRDPVEKMITYLTTYFRPDRVEEGFDLSIAGGQVLRERARGFRVKLRF